MSRRQIDDEAKKELERELLEYFPPSSRGYYSSLTRAIGIKKVSSKSWGSLAIFRRGQRLLDACRLLEEQGMTRDEIRGLLDDPSATLVSLVLAGDLRAEKPNASGPHELGALLDL